MFAMAFMSIALFSCQKTSIDELTQTNNLPKSKAGNTPKSNGEVINGLSGNPNECPATVVSLIAGQYMDAGSVTVTNDYSYIYVTYTTTGNWVLTQTHLYVGACELIPVNNSGNPRIGHFPYSSAHANLTTYTYQVPISALYGCGCIAAHAVVKQLDGNGNTIQTQTAWGNGTQITPGGSWAMKFSYCNCNAGT